MTVWHLQHLSQYSLEVLKSRFGRVDGVHLTFFVSLLAAGFFGLVPNASISTILTITITCPAKYIEEYTLYTFSKLRRTNPIVRYGA